MTAQDSRLNRPILALMIILYLISIGGFTYANKRVEPDQLPWMMAVNALILSLPLILLYGAIYVLISAWRERKTTGQISSRLSRIIHWAPRIAAIVITFFISLFSLDTFEAGKPALEILGAFLMHNIPTFVMIAALVWAWHRPVVGFILFFVAGLFFLRFVFLGGFGPAHFLLFSGPLLLVSALFYTDWRWNKPQPSGADKAAE